jgi:hypothetical protein
MSILTNRLHRILHHYSTAEKNYSQIKTLSNVKKNSRWTEGKRKIVLMPDDGRKAETCSKIKVHGISILIIVLTKTNNNNKNVEEKQKRESNAHSFFLEALGRDRMYCILYSWKYSITDAGAIFCARRLYLLDVSVTLRVVIGIRSVYASDRTQHDVR